MRIVEEQFDAAEVRELLVYTDRLIPGEIVEDPRHPRRLPSRPLDRVPRLEVPVLQELEVRNLLHPAIEVRYHTKLRPLTPLAVSEPRKEMRPLS